jgi:hypothetical protein
MKSLYPNLTEFFGTYFHQDWRDDSTVALEIVERYLAEWPLEEIRQAAQELRRLLAESLTEADLADEMRGFGNFYNPQADGLSYGDWLRQVYMLLTTKIGG